jgi:hypothetical protein
MEEFFHLLAENQNVSILTARYKYRIDPLAGAFADCLAVEPWSIEAQPSHHIVVCSLILEP